MPRESELSGATIELVAQGFADLLIDSDVQDQSASVESEIVRMQNAIDSDQPVLHYVPIPTSCNSGLDLIIFQQELTINQRIERDLKEVDLIMSRRSKNDRAAMRESLLEVINRHSTAILRGHLTNELKENIRCSRFLVEAAKLLPNPAQPEAGLVELDEKFFTFSRLYRGYDARYRTSIKEWSEEDTFVFRDAICIGLGSVSSEFSGWKCISLLQFCTWTTIINALASMQGKKKPIRKWMQDPMHNEIDEVFFDLHGHKIEETPGAYKKFAPNEDDNPIEEVAAFMPHFNFEFFPAEFFSNPPKLLICNDINNVDYDRFNEPEVMVRVMHDMRETSTEFSDLIAGDNDHEANFRRLFVGPDALYTTKTLELPDMIWEAHHGLRLYWRRD